MNSFLRSQTSGKRVLPNSKWRADFYKEAQYIEMQTNIRQFPPDQREIFQQLT